jgi:hypothetical protein
MEFNLLIDRHCETGKQNQCPARMTRLVGHTDGIFDANTKAAAAADDLGTQR